MESRRLDGKVGGGESTSDSSAPNPALVLGEGVGRTRDVKLEEVRLTYELTIGDLSMDSDRRKGCCCERGSEQVIPGCFEEPDSGIADSDVLGRLPSRTGPLVWFEEPGGNESDEGNSWP